MAYLPKFLPKTPPQKNSNTRDASAGNVGSGMALVKPFYLLLFQGIKAVIAESYERIHRSNLVGMGVVPLQYQDGQTAESLGLTGKEQFTIDLPPVNEMKPRQLVYVKAGNVSFEAVARFDTELELAYYKNGGILHYMIRKVLA